MAQDYTFNYANLNPVSGWSASSIAALQADNASLSEKLDAAKTAETAAVGSKKNTPAAVQAHLEKKHGAEQAKFDQQKATVDSHQHALDALTTALAAATDPKVREQLQKELDKQHKKLGDESTKLTAQQTHLTALQDRITQVGTTTAGGTAVQGQANYFSDLVDKTLGSRAGVSGWHGAFGVVDPNPATVIGANGQPVVAASGTAPVVTPTVTTPAVTTPAVTTTAVTPAVTSDPLATSTILSPFELNAQKRLAKINAQAAKRAAKNPIIGTYSPTSGWV